MIVYQLTEEQKQALLKELAFERFQDLASHLGTEAERSERAVLTEAIHRRFHYLVCKALS